MLLGVTSGAGGAGCGLGVEAVSTVNQLQSISGDLYSHPFLVSNTALDAQTKVTQLRNDMLGIVLHGSDSKQRESLIAEAVNLNSAIRSDFRTIRSDFLGDKGRLDEIDRQLGEWEQLRTRVIGLVQMQKHDQARQLVAGEGRKIFDRVEGDTNYVVNFSRRKAAFYVEESVRASAERIQEIWWLLGGLAALFSALIFVIARRIFSDIGRSEQFARELMESEQKFHMLFESANDCMLLLSLDGCIIDINLVGHERLGYAKLEMLGKPIAKFNSPEYAEKIPQRMARILGDGHAAFESEHVRKDGSRMPVEISARIIELSGQRMYYSVIRDISERKQFESKLRAREARYRGVIETSADGFWAVDMEGHLVEVNDAYVRLSGYSREELLSMRVSDLEAMEQSEETAAHIVKIINEGHDRFETVHRRKNGSSWPVEIVVNYWPAVEGMLLVFETAIPVRPRGEE